MSISIGKLAELAGIDRRLGSFDYAVPMGWMMEDPEKRRPHVWWYPYDRRKPGHLYGRPLAWKALARLALRAMRRMADPQLHLWLECWAYLHPGKALDDFGIHLIRRWMAEFQIETIAEANAALILTHRDIPFPEFLPADSWLTSGKSFPEKAAPAAA